MESPSSRVSPEEEYAPLYKGIGRGDTWTLPENLAENPRAALVAHTREKFNGPVQVLDIGCGKGINTKWIAETDRDSHWIGIDALSIEDLGLQIPLNNEHFAFVQGDVLDKSFQNHFNDAQKKFEIIVDQGSILAEIEDDATRSQYLEFINNQLNVNGRFVILVMKGDGKIIVFPDGRKRRTYSAKEFKSQVFTDKFDVEESNLYSYSYLPERSDHPEIKNPLGAKVGDKQQLTAMQIVLKKRIAKEMGTSTA